MRLFKVMQFFVIACVFLLCNFHECYGSYYGSKDYGGGSASDSQNMSLKSERNLPTISRFINYQRDMPNNNINPDWYRQDEEGNDLGDRANFTDNILKILLKELVDRFEKSQDDRIDVIRGMLELINEFISERFIPTHHQEAIKRVFRHIVELQHKPVMQICNLVFAKLSDQAQDKFKEGVRVQTHDLDRAVGRNNSEFEAPDPVLVEILFMQLVNDAVDSSENRQTLLNRVREIMSKMEKLFGQDDKYAIVGSFSSLRSRLLSFSNNESPLPETVRFIVSLVKGHKKQINDKYQDFLEDKDQEKWEKLSDVKTKQHVSMWKKKELPKQKTQAEIDEAKKEKEEKAKKSWFKTKVKGTKTEALEGLEKTGADLATKQFSGLMSSFTNSIKSILPFG